MDTTAVSVADARQTGIRQTIDSVVIITKNAASVRDLRNVAIVDLQYGCVRQFVLWKQIEIKRSDKVLDARTNTFGDF